MKTIAVDIRMLNSPTIGRYINNLLPRIIEYFPDFNFVLLGYDREILESEFTKYKNVNFINCTSKTYSISEQIELLFKIPNNTDVFWAPSHNVPIFYRNKILATVHDLESILVRPTRNNFAKIVYSKCMLGILRKKATKIICPSAFIKNEFLKHTGDSNTEKICTINNGLDYKWFSALKQHSPYDKPYLLYVDNFQQHNNIPVLINAFNLIKDQIPHDLLIVGVNDEFTTRVKDRIHFIGFVEEDILSQYYFHAGALVCPSVYDGFNYSPLEAMACGCPTIVANSSSMTEICQNSSLYFTPYNYKELSEKILNVLNNDGLTNSLATKGFSQVRKYSIENTVNQITYTLLDLLGISTEATLDSNEDYKTAQV